MRVTRNNIKIICMASCLLFAVASVSAQKIDLSGEWRFAIDRAGEGVSANWFTRSLPDRIKLPGILQSQNYGDEIGTNTPWVLSLYDRNWFDREDYKPYTKTGNVKVPFLSQPPRHYIGSAWYQRDVNVPEAWRGKRIVLTLERPKWQTTVWLDDKKVGSRRSLVAPHEFDLGIVEPGNHRLTILVDNSMIMPYRLDAHAVSDSLGMSWNGITGAINLKATSLVWIDDAQVFTTGRETKGGNPTRMEGVLPTARVRIKLGNSTAKPGKGTITANGKSFPVTWTKDGGTAEIELTFANARSWNEFHPSLQKLKLTLKGGDADDSRDITFGFREIKAVGKEFRLDGLRIYFRGTHHGGDFPLTGYPPTDVAYWKKIFQINKDWGINHVRFHSFCPPDAAFQAADELGIYLQPEPGMWNEVSPGTPMEAMLYEETELMIRAYGNHPSFLLFSPSNEPKGRWKEAFDKWIAHYRIADPRRLYTNGTGHTEREVPNLAEGTDYLAMQRIGPKMLRGNTAWFGQDYGKSLDDVNIPVVSHELGQWVAYPDYDVIKKFTGYMRPGNYEIFRDSLAKKGLLSRNKDFAYASGRYQLACYKEEIEANLRTPGLDGFQLLDLHDYLGQGTALVGLLDTFWEEKGYVTAKEFRRFNNVTVPLARLAKRVFTLDEQLTVPVEVAHFGEHPLDNVVASWKIIDASGRVHLRGKLPARSIRVGKNIPLGTIDAKLLTLATPAHYKLVIGLDGTAFENDWDFYLYPAAPPVETKTVLVTSSWTAASERLAAGGKVLYTPRKSDLDWTSPPLDWVPVFWNRLMNPAWGRMLGMWIDNKHPALRKFPTENYNGWQWTEIVRNARAVNLDNLPRDLQPIVQPIDDWNRNYKLGLIFEAKVGNGKLMVASVDLETLLKSRIAARQLRHSLLSYMESSEFDPKIVITPEQVESLFFDTRIMKRIGATVSGDAMNVIDGDPNTFWIAGDAKASSRQNQELTIKFPNAVSFSGLVMMPRQNHREHEGDIREYSIQISDDGTKWTEVKRDELISSFDPQAITFGKNVVAKFVKVTSLSGFGADKTTALADVAVIYTGPKLPDSDEEVEYKRSKAASPDIDEGVTPDEKKSKKP
ncbi:MAG: glycoside hydrolase [Acidobacteria bacterium]|nr:MAG: glycoside hydrolase [Acidobacteriota bacterium]